jgi:hypothetical protein
VRLLDSEKAKKVPKKIHTLGARRRARLDMQFAVRHLVVRQSARPQARDVGSSRDGIFVFVRSPVNDSVDHCPKIVEANIVKSKIIKSKIVERKSFSEIIVLW